MRHLRVWACGAIVRIPEPKRKKLGEREIDCIFIRYAPHSKAYKFVVIKPIECISVNTVIESRNTVFDEKGYHLFLDLKMQILIILTRKKIKFKIFNMTMLRTTMLLNLEEARELGNQQILGMISLFFF